jgi:hypothetical protein
MFVHTVFFWVKPHTPTAAIDQLEEDCEEMLKPIESVRTLYAGRPAMTARDVVDNSYAVGLTVIFDDQAGHDLYQTHPKHLEFMARNKQHWSRVQIYDAV